MRLNNSRLADRIAALKSPKPVAPMLAALGRDEAMEAYLTRLKMRAYSRHTLRGYRSNLSDLSRWLRAPLLSAERRRLERYITEQASRSLKPASVGRKMAALRSFYRWALREELITTDPTAHFEAPKLEARIPIHLTHEQADAFLAALSLDTPRQRRDAAMMSCLYYTGMRAGELVGLDLEALRLDDESPWLTVFGKGKKERVIPVPSALTDVLRMWLADHPSGEGALFVTIGDRPRRLGYDQARRIFQATVRRAGLQGKGFTPHKLRHTYATRLINGSVPIDAIQKLLGHASIETTTIYAHTRIDQGTRAAIERLM